MVIPGSWCIVKTQEKKVNSVRGQDILFFILKLKKNVFCNPCSNVLCVKNGNKK